MSNLSANENPAQLYVKLLQRLHALIAAGSGDTDEADEIRDRMEVPWRLLTQEERQRFDALSVDLYALAERAAKQVPIAGPSPSVCLETEGRNRTVQEVVQGTVKADGTLELDQKVQMPPGRVQVTVQPAVQPAPNDPFSQSMEKIWAEQKARGQVPRTREEIDAEINTLRDESDQEIEEAIRLHDSCHQQEKPPTEKAP